MRIKIGFFLVVSIFCFALKSQQVQVVDFNKFKELYEKNNDTAYVINFFASWCAPCVNELPEVVAFAKKQKKQKTKTLLVSLDFLKDKDVKLIPLLKKLEITELVYLLHEKDSTQWINKFYPSWTGDLPATFIIKNGVINKIKNNSFSKKNIELEIKNINSKQVSKFDFSLKNIDGNKVSLSNYPEAKGFVIIFTCNHCPFAKLYPPRLNDLNTKYAALGVPVIAISSTDTITYEEDRFENMVLKAKNDSFNFPYLFDGTQEVAKNYHAQKTPHAFVIWKVNGKWEIKYNGAIDDNGADPALVQKKFIELAVDALLQNKLVQLPETKSIGCQIHFRKR